MSLAALAPTSAYESLALSAPVISILGFTVGGMLACVGPFLGQSFSTEIENTCIALAYDLGRSAGASTFATFCILAAHVPLDDTIKIFCIASYAPALVALSRPPKTFELRRDLVRSAIRMFSARLGRGKRRRQLPCRERGSKRRGSLHRRPPRRSELRSAGGQAAPVVPCSPPTRILSDER